ncbi:pancreatic triacylglycerol lipase [Anoplolepis gracilipes]|uniref:pancreatic triacylglycerol lipase n=1 Tax=Anoplolepis gracilipes TaxID=354296 RepID=UPI003BA32BDD
MVSPAIALLYPTHFLLLATLTTRENYVFFADDHGTSYMIDVSKPVPTSLELFKIQEDVLETYFLLYTRNNSQEGQQLIINDKNSVENSFWNPERPTCVFAHGWQTDIDPGSAAALIRDAFLSVGDYNVILVDWRKAAGSLWYWKVVKGVPLVAGLVTKLINFLEKDAGLNTSRIGLIGHSLGAHVVGLAARNANGNIAEVMALDPARFEFESKRPGERVDKTDADSVQVIHTSSLGISEPIGDADFYPNGGNLQPGCSRIVPACAHSRSFEYYAESVTNPTGFRAGDVFMGGPSFDRNAQGKYTLQTRRSSPFALG